MERRQAGREEPRGSEARGERRPAGLPEGVGRLETRSLTTSAPSTLRGLAARSPGPQQGDRRARQTRSATIPLAVQQGPDQASHPPDERPTEQEVGDQERGEIPMAAPMGDHGRQAVEAESGQ